MSDTNTCCSSEHTPADTACRNFERGQNGRCVYCDHEEKCHPGPGATCEIGSGENGPWLPTVENINALPEPIRAYIHDLETRADPAGDVRARILAEDTVRSLLIKLERVSCE